MYHVIAGLETVGVFRRVAGKSRLGVLRGLMETNPGERPNIHRGSSDHKPLPLFSLL